MSKQHVAPTSKHDGPLEKDYGNGNQSRQLSSAPLVETNTGSEYLDSSHDPSNALHRIRTAGSISISPELFEKIYLSPQNKVSGDLRKTFANPTPV